MIYILFLNNLVNVIIKSTSTQRKGYAEPLNVMYGSPEPPFHFHYFFTYNFLFYSLQKTDNKTQKINNRNKTWYLGPHNIQVEPMTSYFISL